MFSGTPFTYESLNRRICNESHCRFIRNKFSYAVYCFVLYEMSPKISPNVNAITIYWSPKPPDIALLWSIMDRASMQLLESGRYAGYLALQSQYRSTVGLRWIISLTRRLRTETCMCISSGCSCLAHRGLELANLCPSGAERCFWFSSIHWL